MKRGKKEGKDCQDVSKFIHKHEVTCYTWDHYLTLKNWIKSNLI